MAKETSKEEAARIFKETVGAVDPHPTKSGRHRSHAKTAPSAKKQKVPHSVKGAEIGVRITKDERPAKVTHYARPVLVKKLRILKEDSERTLTDLMNEAIGDLLKKYKR